jgi:hypothetical protein
MEIVAAIVFWSCDIRELKKNLCFFTSVFILLFALSGPYSLFALCRSGSVLNSSSVTKIDYILLETFRLFISFVEVIFSYLCAVWIAEEWSGVHPKGNLSMS